MKGSLLGCLFCNPSYQQHTNQQTLKKAKLLQKSEMRKDIVIELSYKGFG